MDSPETRDEGTIRAGYRYSCALASDPDTARDLVHNAWLSLRGRHGSRPDRALLFRAIRHRHIDEFRRRSRHLHVDYDDEDRGAHAAGAGSENVAEPPDPRLAAALEGLRDVEREALFLAVVEGYTASEIGRLTNSPRGTVLSLIHRARAKLRERLVSRGGNRIGELGDRHVGKANDEHGDKHGSERDANLDDDASAADTLIVLENVR